MNKNSSWETSVKPVVVLSVIALIVSLLLAMVNSFTAPIIEDNQKAATLAAYVDVMPTVSSASDLEEVTDYTTENITGAVKATDGSLAIKAEEKGFDGGILSVIIGFDTNGTVTGIWVDASTQTKGIGSGVADEDFLKQFDGLDCTQNVVMGENGVDGKTGATFSSKALFAAINDDDSDDAAVKAGLLGLDGQAAVRSLDHAGDIGGGVAGHFLQLSSVRDRRQHADVSSQRGALGVLGNDRGGHGVHQSQQQADDQRDHAQHDDGLDGSLPVGIRGLTHLSAPSFAFFAGLT